MFLFCFLPGPVLRVVIGLPLSNLAKTKPGSQFLEGYEGDHRVRPQTRVVGQPAPEETGRSFLLCEVDYLLQDRRSLAALHHSRLDHIKGRTGSGGDQAGNHRRSKIQPHPFREVSRPDQGMLWRIDVVRKRDNGGDVINSTLI